MNFASIFLVITLFLLTGCVAMRDSTPPGAIESEKGIKIVRLLPSKLPGKSSPVPDSQYVLVNAQSGLLEVFELIMPVPFVTEYAVESVHDRAARKYREPLAAVDPYMIAVKRMEGSALLTNHDDALKMMPYVYAVIGSDSQARLTLVFHVEGDGWMGRYMYHMPTVLASAEMKTLSEERLQQLHDDLLQGSDILRQLMERDVRDELNAIGDVDIGSYYLVGSRVLGMIPASIMHYPDTHLVEEEKGHIVIRSRGDLKADAPSGGLVFGVHYFRKDQLHTYKKQEAAQ